MTMKRTPTPVAASSSERTLAAAPIGAPLTAALRNAPELKYRSSPKECGPAPSFEPKAHCRRAKAEDPDDELQQEGERSEEAEHRVLGRR